jgi:hypothetical protein
MSLVELLSSISSSGSRVLKYVKVVTSVRFVEMIVKVVLVVSMSKVLVRIVERGEEWFVAVRTQRTKYSEG